MSGSKIPSKTLEQADIQLPLKGFTTAITEPASGRRMQVEGMGDGRYRILTLKRPPKQE